MACIKSPQFESTHLHEEAVTMAKNTHKIILRVLSRQTTMVIVYNSIDLNLFFSNRSHLATNDIRIPVEKQHDTSRLWWVFIAKFQCIEHLHIHKNVSLSITLMTHNVS